MRSFFRLSILTLAACAAILPAARAKDLFEVTVAPELVGTWVAKTQDKECFITFSADSNFKGTITSLEGIENPFAGTWSLSRSSKVEGFICMELHYNYTKFGQACEMKDMDLIVDRTTSPVTGNTTLVFQTSKGERRAYTKVEKPAQTPPQK